MPPPWRRNKRPTEPAPQPVTVTVSGSGHAVSTGDNNQQYVGSVVTTPPPDAGGLEQAIAALRAVVEAHPGPRREEALAQVSELDKAAASDPPNGPVLVRTKDWLTAAVPSAAPALADILLHPSIATAVNAAAQVIRDTALRHGEQEQTGTQAEPPPH